MPSQFNLANSLEVAQFTSTHSVTYDFINPAKIHPLAKSVVITGASMGVGRRTAVRLATAGASKIGLIARSSLAEVKDEIKAAAEAANRAEPEEFTFEADVTSERSVKAASEAISVAFGGKLDVLISNAGYLEIWTSVTASNPSEWWRSMEVNLYGTYLIAHHFIPLLLRSPDATFISLTSLGAHSIIPGASASQTAKFALCRFTEFIHQEYADQGLTAIAIHPGSVKTKLSLKTPEYIHDSLQDSPDLPADTMVWLVKERREWLAGRFISANWDMEELEKRKSEILDKDLLKFRLTI